MFKREQNDVVLSLQWQFPFLSFMSLIYLYVSEPAKKFSTGLVVLSICNFCEEQSSYKFNCFLNFSEGGKLETVFCK